MADKVPVALMQTLFEMLETENHCRVKVSGQRIVDEMIRNRWTFRWEIEDLLICSDSRCHHLDLDGLATVFDLPLRWVSQVPRFEATDPAGSRGIAAIDAAALCIHLEALGFDARPGPLVERLVPQIDRTAYVSDSELMVLRYERERLRTRRQMKADTVDRDGEWTTSRLKGPDGRRIELTRVGGVAYRLDVKGPKYRPPKERTYIKCAQCHAEYLPGDKESSLRHRSEHAKRMRVFDPRPTPAFLRRLATSADPEVVDRGSPLWMHKAIYQRAVYFRREFGYSFIQWDGTETSKNVHEEARGHLFASHKPGAEGIGLTYRRVAIDLVLTQAMVSNAGAGKVTATLVKHPLIKNPVVLGSFTLQRTGETDLTPPDGGDERYVGSLTLEILMTLIEKAVYFDPPPPPAVVGVH